MEEPERIFLNYVIITGARGDIGGDREDTAELNTTVTRGILEAPEGH